MSVVCEPKTDLPDSFFERGWPRKWVRRANGTLLPIQWIFGPPPPSWPNRLSIARVFRICSVCGDPLEGTVIHPRYVGAPFLPQGDRLTAPGSGTHPRCALLATQTCPHLKRQHADEAEPDDVIAFAWDGPRCGAIPFPPEVDKAVFNGDGLQCVVHSKARPLTYGELRELAKTRAAG